MSEKCVHEWYYRIVDICSWQFFCIRCGEKLSMDKFSDHASDLEKRMAELGKATACIAELEEENAGLKAVIDQLIEVGNGMKSFLTPYVDGFRDSYPATSAWESLVKDLKEG